MIKLSKPEQELFTSIATHKDVDITTPAFFGEIATVEFDKIRETLFSLDGRLEKYFISTGLSNPIEMRDYKRMETITVADNLIKQLEKLKKHLS